MLLFMSVWINGCSSKGAVPIEGREEQSASEEIASSTETTEDYKTKELWGRKPTPRGIEEYHAIDNEPYAWWFRRNKEHKQAGCQEDFDIGEYDAFYVAEGVEEPVFYLTFDCGYENGYTETILDILKEEHVYATFFVTQTYIRDNVELVKRMKEEGHYVGNHTVSHPNMPSLSVEEQQEEIRVCQEYMKEATGYVMDPFYRPPKGEYSKRCLQVAKDMGYITVFWSMAYLDYQVDHQPTPEHVVEHVDLYCHPGTIALMHNVSSANCEALPTVINHLREAGYRFGTLDELSLEFP